MIHVIETIEALSAFEHEWMTLYESCFQPTPFQHFRYVLRSWDLTATPKDRLYVVTVVRQKDKLVQAVFPCYVDRSKRLRFINDVNSDFCNALIHKDFVEDYHLYEEFAKHYSNDKTIQGAQLINLMAFNPLFPSLGYLLKGSLCRPVNMYSEFDIVSRNEGSKTFVDELKQLNTKERYRLKNVLKKSQSFTLAYYMAGEASYPESAVEELVCTMVKQGIRTENYFSNGMKQFWRNLYEDGLLQVFVSMEHGNPVAANLYFLNAAQGEYIDWISLYSEKRYNLCNLLQTVEHISKTGGTLNFARGTYEYKIHNFRPRIHFLYGIYHSKRPQGQLKDLYKTTYYYLRLIAKSILRK